MRKPHKGQRVIVKCAIDRFPHFVVPLLSLGTVNSVSEDPTGNILVKMDKPISGCEAWDNCVMCYGMVDFFANFEDLLICQLEAALSIITNSDDADEHEEWIKNTCAALKDAGSVHPVIARYNK